MDPIAETVTILGHMRPDVDCATSMWIASRFLLGTWFPDKSATFEFAKANKMSNLVNDVEHFHIIVDGGGVYDPARRRFDTHGNKDLKNECATSLLSRELPANVQHQLEELIENVRMHDVGGPREDSKTRALVSLYSYLSTSYGANERGLVNRWCRILDAWYYETVELQQLVLDASRLVTYSGATAVLPPDSPRALTSKVFRENIGIHYVVFQNAGSLGVMIDTRSRHKGHVRLPNGFTKALFDLLHERNHGSEFGEWFFHPAGFYVGRGSVKSPVETPSCLTQADLLNLLTECLAKQTTLEKVA